MYFVYLLQLFKEIFLFLTMDLHTRLLINSYKDRDIIQVIIFIFCTFFLFFFFLTNMNLELAELTGSLLNMDVSGYEGAVKNCRKVENKFEGIPLS